MSHPPLRNSDASVENLLSQGCCNRRKTLFFSNVGEMSEHVPLVSHFYSHLLCIFAHITVYTQVNNQSIRNEKNRDGRIDE